MFTNETNDISEACKKLMKDEEQIYDGFDECFLKRNATLLAAVFTEFYSVEIALGKCLTNKDVEYAFLNSFFSISSCVDRAYAHMQTNEFNLTNFSDENKYVRLYYQKVVNDIHQ